MASLEDEFALKLQSRTPKCLAGVSIMLVDDSRSVSEAVRMMATASGARIRRADSIASAQRHVMLFRPKVVLVDLGLPDGNGVEVAELVAQKVDPKPGVLILTAAFQEAVLGVLPGRADGLPDWNAEFSAELSGTDFFEQDLGNALDLFEEALRDDNPDELAFGAQFLAGVASTAGDKELEQCARKVSARLGSGHRGLSAASLVVDVLSSRLAGNLSATG